MTAPSQDQDDATQRRLVFRLTDEQHDLLQAETGVTIDELRLSPQQAMACALASSAFSRGWQPRTFGRPMRLVLTDAQRRQVVEATGISVDEWLVDADALQPRTYWEEWADGHRPLGERFVIAGPADAEPTAPGRTLIRLAHGDGVKVFGTGRHPTTRLCAALLEEALRAGDVVADVGTGSGVLALVAANLGAASVVGYEIDPRAAGEARRNVELNGFRERVAIAAEFSPLEEAFDGLVVNMIASVLRQMLPGIARAVRPGGWVVAGGLVSSRVPDVVVLATSTGLELEGRRTEGRWSAVVLRRVSPDAA